MARQKGTPNTKWKNGLKKVKEVWHYHFTLYGKSHHGSTRCTDLASAREVLERVKRDALVEHYQPGVSDSVKEAGKAWVTYLKNQGRSLRHRELAQAALDKVVYPAIGEEQMGDLNQCHVDTVLAEARKKRTRWGKPWADSTVDHTLIYFRTFLGWARERDMLRRTLKVRTVTKGDTPTKVALNEEQLQAFLAAIDGRNDRGLSLAVRAMVFMGLRVSEALAMEWSRWDFQRRIYTPNPATTKNRKECPLPVTTDLADWIETQPRINGYILPDKNGEPRNRLAIYHIIRRTAAKLGIQKFSPHGLRRTLGTILAESGINPKTIQGALRHSSSTVTMKSYIVGGAEQARPAIDALEARVTQPEPLPINITPLRWTGTTQKGQE